jgi:hypothetical protein
VCVFVGFGLASLASDCMRALWCLATNWCARFVLFCWLGKMLNAPPGISICSSLGSAPLLGISSFIICECK